MRKLTEKNRVLIVDDHPLFCEGLGRMIDRHPSLKVCGQAPDALSAMKAVAELKPDLVLVDISLEGGTNGIDLIKSLKAKYEELPILVVSMHDESLYAERALRAGAQGYIMKNQPIQIVRDAIFKVLGGEIFLSQKMSTSVLAKLLLGKKEESISPIEKLSDRELEVFQLLGEGKSSREIAETLTLTIPTIHSFRNRIKEKLQFKNATELVLQHNAMGARTSQQYLDSDVLTVPLRMSIEFCIQRFFCRPRWLLVFLLACKVVSSARADLWITGYYPGYETGVMSPSNIDFTAVTHVIHFALVPESNGSINSNANSLTGSACSRLVGLAHAAGRKALVCVGGAGTESDFLGATTSANLASFVSNIIDFMAGNAYDGVDLDWEPFNSADTAQYTNLVNGLRAALNGFAARKMLTVAAPAYPEYGDSPTAEFSMLASVQNQFDQINIMTYDLSGPYEGWVTWYNSPIYDGGYTFPSDPSELVPSINGAISNFVNNGVQPGKLGVGLPFYGYIWTGGPGVTQPRQSWPATNPPTVSTASYATIVNAYYESNLYHWDDVAQAAYLSLTNSSASSDMFISYDDIHACQANVSHARNLRLGGLMIWELSQDYLFSQPAGARTPLTSALKQALATPNIATIDVNGTNASLSFTSLPLGLYTVQWSSNLSVSSWNTLASNVAGTGTNIPITDPTPATNPARFYRIQTPP